MISALLASVPGILHGFGDRATPVPSLFSANWDRRPRHDQVHGARAVAVTTLAQECGQTDALYTFESGIPLPIVTADCVPLLLARKDGGAVAGAHAGWRGTRAHIARELWNALAARGERASDWVAAVGPAIGPCCYEVSEELAADFSKEFGPTAVPRTRYLDLPLVNAQELKALGIAEVDLLRACTRCSRTGASDFRLNSYRREGSGTRQYSVISVLG